MHSNSSLLLHGASSNPSSVLKSEKVATITAQQYSDIFAKENKSMSQLEQRIHYSLNLYEKIINDLNVELSTNESKIWEGNTQQSSIVMVPEEPFDED